MLHESLLKYLAEIEEAVHAIPKAHVELYTEERLSPTRVNLRIRLRLSKKFLLELNDAISIEDEQLSHRRYRYHFQDQRNNLIFRYDSAPHFPDLLNFPHHKHLPHEVVPCEKPSIQDVIREVVQYIGSA
jgi:hypothetical protein